MVCGWLSPQGEFFCCEPYGHVNLAEKLVKDCYGIRQWAIPDEILLERFWIKLYADGMITGYLDGETNNYHCRITPQQVSWLMNQSLSTRQKIGLESILKVDKASRHRKVV